MEALKKGKLSLVQTISAVFIAITIMVILLAVTSIKGIDRVEREFSRLSDQALPLAMTNADLMQTILEQSKQLSYSTQATTYQQLDALVPQIERLQEQNIQSSNQVLQLSAQFGQAISSTELKQLSQQVVSLNQLTSSVINTQRDILLLQQDIDSELEAFRYGLGSAGPEMSRISAFLVGDNPESADAANRFIANVSAMESGFVQLLMEQDREQAIKEYKQLKNRLAGVELAYDDFKQWHPDVTEFSSLTSAYEMVLVGFKPNAIVDKILQKLKIAHKQGEQVVQVVMVADTTVEQLNTISASAKVLIDNGQGVVTTTIERITTTLFTSSGVMVLLVLVAGVVLRVWINRSLNNILSCVTNMTEHDLTSTARLIGPRELHDVSIKLNSLATTTQDSIARVTSNCETLYQAAEVSHCAASQSNRSLSLQNESLATMVNAVNQLDTSIRQIAQVTNESYQDSEHASQHSNKGVEAIEQNQIRLKALAESLNANEASMLQLDKRVNQISEMVDLISGIAENTNLLALNAAIEAARAGEQGRGFAVVADEVRKLASDTSAQTTNIRARMDQLVVAAQASKSAVEESRIEMTNALTSSEMVKETFAHIESSVGHIRARAEQVSIATKEQQSATANVSEAITRVTKQGEQTQEQLESMVESSQQVASIAEQQQAMLHKYVI
ncbi:methyl-accepting chemotaxis protein [Vibrio hepatarius]|uniref:methyl-accepting chemotaxis protein n=1 Tax=Vibrio hepatarius TaxID=171383 RepID=UPI0037368469